MLAAGPQPVDQQNLCRSKGVSIEGCPEAGRNWQMVAPLSVGCRITSRVSAAKARRRLFRALASRRPAPRLRPLQTLVMLPGTSVLLAHLLRQVDLEQ